jgi:hypothetical protein
LAIVKFVDFMQKLVFLIIFSSISLVSPSFCQQANLSKLPAYHVEPAPEWTNQFKRNNGWFGGDGIFTIAKSGRETNLSKNSKVWFHFSDSFIGSVNNNIPDSNTIMVNNSLGYWENTGISPAPISFSIPLNNLDEPETSTVFHPI